jgi:hypothetical protein
MPIDVALGLRFPDGIALGANDIYVTVRDDETVLSIPKQGGAPTTLADNEVSVRGVAITGTTLFWANSDRPYDDAGARGGLWRCELPACEKKQIVAAINTSEEPVIKNGLVYFEGSFDPLGNRVLAVPLAGGTPFNIAIQGDYALAADDANVYFTVEGKLWRTLADGGSYGTEQVIVSPAAGGAGGYVALDATRVYWAYVDPNNDGHVISVAKAAPTAGNLDYGATADNIRPIGITVDDAYVYWSTDGTVATGGGSNRDGKLFACRKEGCGNSGPLLLATGVRFSGPMVTDDRAIYWIEAGDALVSDGRVRKIAKP